MFFSLRDNRAPAGPLVTQEGSSHQERGTTGLRDNGTTAGTPAAGCWLVGWGGASGANPRRYTSAPLGGGACSRVAQAHLAREGEARGQEGAQCTEHALGALAVGEEREARAVLRRVPLGASHVHVDAGLPKAGRTREEHTWCTRGVRSLRGARCRRGRVGRGQ